MSLAVYPWPQQLKNDVVNSKHAYNSSPFFEYYKDELKPFFEEKEKYAIAL